MKTLPLWQRLSCLMAGAVLWFVLLGVYTAETKPDAPLAHPSATLAEWQTNPQSAMQAVIDSNQKLLAFYSNMTTGIQWGAWLVGGLGVLVTIAKFLPPPYNSFADLASGLLRSKHTQASDEAQDTLAGGFLGVAEIMRQFPADAPLGHVLDQLERKLPPEVKAAYLAWEKTNADPRPAMGTWMPPVVLGRAPVVGTASTPTEAQAHIQTALVRKDVGSDLPS